METSVDPKANENVPHAYALKKKLKISGLWNTILTAGSTEEWYGVLNIHKFFFSLKLQQCLEVGV